MAIRNILYHPISIVIITILAILFYISLEQSSKKTEQSAQQIEILESEVNQLSDKIISLEEKIVLADSDEFKEKVVRNELLLQKEGEYILQIPESADSENKNCTNSDCEIDQKQPPIALWTELLLY